MLPLAAPALDDAPSGIPSPPQAEWFLGPLPVRAYAICILIGIVLALVILERRYTARGGPRDTATDVAFFMVPAGIIGARVYHVLSSPSAYFGEDGDLVRILYIWEGGLGIWGAVSAGALAAWLALRARGLRLGPFADALAPGLLVAQAVGRLGNWFNQELYGAPTDLPWGLEIDPAHLVAGAEAGTLFHPTFLYELLWNLGAAALLVALERRFRLGGGRVFWLYVMLYTAGRTWIEMLRIDDAETVLGLRLNVWTSALLFLLALVIFLVLGRRAGASGTRGVTGDPAIVGATEGDLEPRDPIWLPGRAPEEDEDAEEAETAREDEAGGEIDDETESRDDAHAAGDERDEPGDARAVEQPTSGAGLPARDERDASPSA